MQLRDDVLKRQALQNLQVVDLVEGGFEVEVQHPVHYGGDVAPGHGKNNQSEKHKQ